MNLRDMWEGAHQNKPTRELTPEDIDSLLDEMKTHSTPVDELSEADVWAVRLALWALSHNLDVKEESHTDAQGKTHTLWRHRTKDGKPLNLKGILYSEQTAYRELFVEYANDGQCHMAVILEDGSESNDKQLIEGILARWYPEVEEK